MGVMKEHLGFVCIGAEGRNGQRTARLTAGGLRFPGLEGNEPRRRRRGPALPDGLRFPYVYANGQGRERSRGAVRQGPGLGSLWILLALLLVPAMTVGCYGGSGDGRGTDGGVPRDGETTRGETHERDITENGLVSIAEKELSADLRDDGLHVSIPLTALSEAAEGRLAVLLQSVDGSDTLDETVVEYDLPEKAQRVLNAVLDSPEGIAQQSDLVRYKVRIEHRGGQPLLINRSLLSLVPAYEVRLEGPSSLARGKKATYRVRAQNPLNRQPVEGLPVQLIVSQDNSEIVTLEEETGETGDAVFEIEAPEEGDYSVSAGASRQGTRVTIGDDIAVTAPGRKVLLTTDKPIYQPGQTIHLRALLLENPANTPVVAQALLFEVEDGKGNKIFKKEISTDDYGIAATTFRLGAILNQGTFKVQVSGGQHVSQKTVEVYRYALPKFDTAITVDRDWYGPGDELSGKLEADYFFGKPVANAEVTIEAATLDVGETVFQTVIGRTDAEGDMSFTVQLPATLAGLPIENGNAVVYLRSTVIDTAGQQVQKELPLTVAERPLDISLVPESTALVPGVENRLHLFVTDPLGAPVANAAAELTAATGPTLTADTDAFGHALLLWTPADAAAAAEALQVTVTAESGETAGSAFSFSAQAGEAHVIVRTDKSVYEVGEVVRVEFITSAGEVRVYVDWLNNGQAVDMRTLDAVDGQSSFTMSLDGELRGSNRIEGYVVDAEGNIVRAGRTIFVRDSAGLQVELEADKPLYAPGEEAKLTFSVLDQGGEPAVAALGVQIVDEAVFALIDARPGLLRTYFELEDEFAEPAYEIHGPRASLPQLLFEQTAVDDPEQAAAAQAKAEATFAALGATSVTGIQLASWPQVIKAAVEEMETYYQRESERLEQPVGAAVVQAMAEVESAGCRQSDYWCEELGNDYATEVMNRVEPKLGEWDFWGNAYRIAVQTYPARVVFQTDGPDEQQGTADDGVVTVTVSDVDLSSQGWTDGGIMLEGPAVRAEDDMANGGFPGATATGGAGSVPPPQPKGGDGDAAEAPRVRKDFPETLYVNPSLITGPDGKATVSVPMADSITEWRVSSLASSANGRLGSGVSGITVFQDFFVDIDFPATLTRGDEIAFPIAVYNYLQEPQTVQLQLEDGDWFTPLGNTTAAVEVGANEVIGVRFPVSVDRVGLQKLTVSALGSALSDAVQRTVRVEPDGKRFENALSGSLQSGQVAHPVDIPAASIAGSETMLLNVYPAFLSQAVQGMDSMLRVPNGCFEQTTSTTWPNVLVTAYMEETGQITPEIQMKAESLISAGYQRLLTFEHSGGGFSWFGEQDPEPFLSVTAFGVMEFADMSAVALVDENMMQRTLTWLLGQQAADGSWEGSQTEFFSFNTDTMRNTAFVVWALASAGETGGELDKGLQYVKAHLNDEELDGYTLGLVANAFVSAAPNDTFTRDILERLDGLKQQDGDRFYWDSAGTQTCFYGGGNDAAVTATALAAHAMLLDGGFPTTVSGALEYLTGSKDANGNFGSTQATIWTLKALLLAARTGTEGAVGSLQVAVNGVPFDSVELTEQSADMMITVDLSTLAAPGAHQIALDFTGQGRVSYNLVSAYHLPWDQAPVEPAGPLSVEVAYDKTSFAMNETVTAAVTVVNNTASTQNMILVTLGIAPGFQVLTEDLDAYLPTTALSSYELTGKQLTLYLDEIPPSEQMLFEYRMQASMPIKAADGGATVAPYYEPEQKSKSPSINLEVTES